MPNYTFPGTLVLKNKLGAKTHSELAIIEGKFAAARDAELAEGMGAKGRLDVDHLLAIHRHLFQDVYEWAGCTRDAPFALSDGTIATEPILRKADGAPFMVGELIPSALDQVSQRIRDWNYLHGLSRREFAQHAADIIAEINAIHAFREGNGRTQRPSFASLPYRRGTSLISRSSRGSG